MRLAICNVHCLFANRKTGTELIENWTENSAVGSNINAQTKNLAGDWVSDVAQKGCNTGSNSGKKLIECILIACIGCVNE